MKTAHYFAESALEAIRLLKKTDLDLTYRQLKEAQLHRMAPGSHIVDLGSGLGIVSNCMEEILSARDIEHNIYSVDLSFNRLSQSDLYQSRPPTVFYTVSDATHLPFNNHSVDFVFSRFLFEYLPAPLRTLREIIRITRPGGKIVTSDLDLNCLSFYPAPETFNTKLHHIARILSEHHLFDAFVGRKLYAFYKAAGLSSIDVRIEGYNIQFGPVSETAYSNWLMKIRYICEGPRKFNIDYGFDINEFQKEFIDILNNPDRFSYATLITVEGVKRSP
jgi:ubiquinone/menaquinone biosynthesis C-methylase UbiE